MLFNHHSRASHAIDARASAPSRLDATTPLLPLDALVAGHQCHRSGVVTDMPRLSASSTTDRPSSGARVFADQAGRLWSVAYVGDAVVFACITGGRQALRAISAEAARIDDAVGDETLRAWLNSAPRIGMLA